MSWRCVLLVLLAVQVAKLSRVSDIRGLAGKGDYRDILVSWEYPQKSWFIVHYCEVQAWGPSRCKAKLVDADVFVEKNSSLQYSAVLDKLRMSTNYSISVELGSFPRRKERSRTILVATKGFSARAVSCLPDVSEVEVETGPYFQGRIGVESGPCSVEGDPNSPRDTYLLRIEHANCGSSTNQTSVATFVLVQESSHILTHSTRRFLVLCTFQPETLTVRAGLNLPHTADGMVESSINDISENEVHASALRVEEFSESESEFGTTLGVIGGILGFIGVGLVFWKFFPRRIFSGEKIEGTNYDNLDNSSTEVRAEEGAVGSSENQQNSTDSQSAAQTSNEQEIE